MDIYLPEVKPIKPEISLDLVLKPITKSDIVISAAGMRPRWAW